MKKLFLIALLVFLPQVALAGSQTFSYTGAAQAFTVPAGVTSISVQLTGAGGGNGIDAWVSCPAWIHAGATGGSTSGTLAVNPGDMLTIIVGGGGTTAPAGGYGAAGAPPTYGGGGPPGTGSQTKVPGGFCGYAGQVLGNTQGGSGGGRSAIRLANGTEVLTAGGGGGAGTATSANNNWIAGPGGGPSGGTGGGTYQASGGGTQSAGGTSLNGGGSGAQFLGGTGANFLAGAGGGGGWYGGSGGGGGSTHTSGTVWTKIGYGAGGGSGYCGGAGVSNCSTTLGAGSPATTNGSVTITWTAILPPTCFVSLSPNPATYSASGTATLTWSATNANTSFYIKNVGYLAGSSGSFTVPRTTSTDYTGTAIGSGGTATCPAALTVTPPSTPTVTITASSNSIYTGQSTNLLARFTAGSGDTLTHDNIDSPEGTGLGAATNPDASKTITFTPSSPGNYTFFARAQTSYFTSWTTYAQTIVHVNNPPSCTPAYTCSGQTIQYQNGGCHISDVTTCASPAFCSAGSSVCLSSQIIYNQSGNGFTGHLQAVPTLVPQNNTTKLFWNLTNVSSCTVTGTNGNTWTIAGNSGNNWKSTPGSSGETSSPITQQTIFTLSCTKLDNSTLNDTPPQVVNVLPVFQER